MAHVAIIERRGTDELRAVIVPVNQPPGLDVNDERPWLLPYLAEGWGLRAMVPVAFIPDEQCRPESWPAGEPNEAEIMAKITRGLEQLVVTIRRGDLERLDAILTLFEAMAEHFSEDMADDIFNLRNHMVPFQPGELHYDSSADEEDDNEGTPQ